MKKEEGHSEHLQSIDNQQTSLVTFTSEIFGIPLMKHSWYALKHCLVDVKEDKRACYNTKEAAIFATCIRGGILEYL
jgi:hypothetical protein